MLLNDARIFPERRPFLLTFLAANVSSSGQAYYYPDKQMYGILNRAFEAQLHRMSAMATVNAASDAGVL
jgi:hypothetical protein